MKKNKNKTHDTVEEPVKDDGVNEGDLDESAVE